MRKLGLQAVEPPPTLPPDRRAVGRRRSRRQIKGDRPDNSSHPGRYPRGGGGAKGQGQEGQEGKEGQEGQGYIDFDIIFASFSPTRFRFRCCHRAAARDLGCASRWCALIGAMWAGRAQFGRQVGIVTSTTPRWSK